MNIVFTEPHEMAEISNRLDAVVTCISRYFGDVVNAGQVSIGVVEHEGQKVMALTDHAGVISDTWSARSVCRSLARATGCNL